MDEDEPFDPDRRGRRLRLVALVGVGTLAMGSCSGMMLGHYTVTGMNPFYTSHRQPAYVAERRDAAESYDWPELVDAGAEARQAQGFGGDATY